MPTVAELERVAALIERLQPLAQAQRGELIRAEEWNTVVDAVIALARAIVADRQQPSLPAHEHLDQVSLSWLDPALRRLIERGPLAEPAALAEVQALDRRAKRLEQRAADLDAAMREVRTRAEEVVTRDLRRERTVVELGQRLERVPDAAEAVRDLRGSLDDLRADIATAAEASERLQLDGEPIDVGALVQRVGQLDQLRQRLTLPDGQMLDALALEQRFESLRNGVVGRDELDERLDRFGGLSPERLSGLRTELAAERDAALADQREVLTAELQGRLDERLSVVDARLSDTLGSLDAQVGALRGQVDAARERLDTALPGLDAGRAEVDALGRTVAELRDQLSGSVSAVDGLRGELLELRATTQDLRREVSQDLDARIDSRLDQRFDQRFTERDAALDERLDARIDARVRQQVDARVTTAVREFTAGEAFRGQLDAAVARNTTTRGDDFTRIDGIGDAFDTRLRERGISSFDGLARTDPRLVARTLNVSEERANAIVRDAARLRGR